MDPRLLAEIIARPDDDAPRLVLADALQGAGDPRGELISVQCELARRGAAPLRTLMHDWIGDALVGDDISELRSREGALLREHGSAWTREARAFTVVDGAIMRRGFVEHLRWDCARVFSRKLAPVLAAAPLVRAIGFATQLSSASLAKFYTWPEVRRLRELFVPESTGLATAKLDLARLDVNHGGGPHEIRAIAAAKWFSGLRALTLTSFGLDGDDIAAIASSARALTELQLISSRCGIAGAEVLVGSPVAKRLEILSLRHGKLVAGDVAALLHGQRFPALAALDLRSNALSAEDIAALAGLPALRVLNLANTKLDERAVRTLATSTWNLRVLDVRTNSLGARSKALLRRGFSAIRCSI